MTTIHTCLHVNVIYCKTLIYSCLFVMYKLSMVLKSRQADMNLMIYRGLWDEFDRKSFVAVIQLEFYSPCLHLHKAFAV